LLAAVLPTRIRLSWLYAAAGLLLGTGAPAGAALLRLAAGSNLFADLRQNAFFYVYMLVSTCAVFGAAGYVAGLRADRLRASRDRFHEMAEKDDLTQLPNSRAFGVQVRRAIEEAGIRCEPVSLLLIDLDSLKSVNDRWGHQVGSASLRHIARLVRDAKRPEDFAARWGGDEFTILMPKADEKAATRLARDILEKVRATPVEHQGGSYPVTVTIGVATANAPPSGFNIFGVADRALYEGKFAGRNQFRAVTARAGGEGGRLR
jgi:diguanylate cyclase (GGDEF)-like protein